MEFKFKDTITIDGEEYDIGMNDQRSYPLTKLSRKELIKEILDCEDEIRDYKSQINNKSKPLMSKQEMYEEMEKKGLIGVNSGDHRKTQKNKESEVK